MADTAKSGGHLLTDEELHRVQSIFLEMAKEVDEVCRRHHICMMLSGGSVIGAVRHKGFIPWDDDLDINIPRKDYNRFLRIFEKELGGRYRLYAPNYHQTAIYRIAKIENPAVRLTDKLGNEHGLMMDLLPMENIPENPLMRYFIGFRASLLMWIAIRVYEYECRGKNDEKQSAIGKLAGRIFSFRPGWKWFDLADTAVQYKKETSLIGIPAGRGHYFGEIYKKKDMLPVIYVPFEDTRLPIPCNADAYLSHLYGDYMTIPEESRRERHKVTKIEFRDEAEIRKEQK